MASGLGRGLDSLIPKKINKIITSAGETIISTVVDDEKGRILNLSPDQIKVNHLQPRKNFSEPQLAELVESIKLYGIIQPLIVTKKDGEYELIAGERRLRSAKTIGLKTVPVIVREAKEQEMLEVALIENIQRENLNPIETAISYNKLVQEFNLTQEDLSKRLGKSRPSISNSLRLLNLPEEIQSALIDGRLTEGHAKLILGLENEVKQMALFRKIAHSGLSVSDTASESRKMGGSKQARVKINYQDKDTEFALRELLGTKVEIKRNSKGGQIVIEFYGDDGLDEVIERMGKK
ncbi:MAG: ParB-like protein partition protein [Parcubacteria group bacterium GW2011_GWE2_38_18]|nr:MAG: ParB-like protein partition protein [Parcubacteria group bacterium GW2011_GWE2_38_18]